MTSLYSRILLWHKLIAQQTGGLALCSVRHRLNREEAQGWSTTFRNVADEIDQVLKDGSFILDERGRRVVECVVDSKDGTLAGETQHVDPDGSSTTLKQTKAASPVKVGGLRVATRKGNK